MSYSIELYTERSLLLDDVKEWGFDTDSGCYVFYGSDDKALAVVPVRSIVYVAKVKDGEIGLEMITK